MKGLDGEERRREAQGKREGAEAWSHVAAVRSLLPSTILPVQCYLMNKPGKCWPMDTPVPGLAVCTGIGVRMLGCCQHTQSDLPDGPSEVK